MKKRNLLVSLLLILTLMITACGQENPFVGSWRGSCDLTDLIIESVAGDEEDLRQYMEEVDGLEFTIYFEFTEDEMSMSVDDSSVDTFLENLENSMKNVAESYLIDNLASTYDITYEEYLMELGMDSDEFLESKLDEMNMNVQMEAMMNSMADALEVSGLYMYDDEKITIVYEDNTYEEMYYVFDQDILTITFVGSDGMEIPIVCEIQ